MTYHAKLIKGGKIVIPAELRRELGFKDGDTLVIEREGDAVVIKTYMQVVKEVQQAFRAMAPKGQPSGNAVDEFLEWRREEARREEEKWKNV